MLHRLRFVVCVFVLMVKTATAGEYNAALDIGDEAPNWQDLQGIDGNVHSDAEFADASFVVLAFLCNSCPYATDAEDRVMQLAVKAKQLGGVLIAINVNNIPADSLEAMKARAMVREFNFVYLHDPSQKIAKDFGATTTPEFFVLDRDRKVAYMGSLDDSPDGTDIKTRHVELAIADIAEGRAPSITETVPIGCRIRFDRVRRTRRAAGQ